MAVIKILIKEHFGAGVEVRCSIEGVDTHLEQELSASMANYLDPLTKQYTDQMAPLLAPIANKPLIHKGEKNYVH